MHTWHRSSCAALALTLYNTVSLPSWSAGSRQVSCSIGATLGNGGWSTLLNSAKGPLLINGRPPVPPPDIPEERLNMRLEAAGGGHLVFLWLVVVWFLVVWFLVEATAQTEERQQSQHLPQQATAPTATQTAAPTTPPEQEGNIFLNGPPPPPRPSGSPTATGCRSATATPTAGGPPPLPPPPPLRAAAAPARAAAAAARARRRPSRCCWGRRQARRRGRSRVAVRMTPQRFDELVSDALDLIPPELAAATDNVVVLVEDRNPEEPDLLGLYQGVALTERDSTYAGSLPDTITIYRHALLSSARPRTRSSRRWRSR